MADATIAGQIVLGTIALVGPVATVFGMQRTLRKERDAQFEKRAADDRALDARFVAADKAWADALAAFKSEVEKGFKDQSKATQDFMPKSDIIRADTGLRGDIDRLSLMLVDTKLQVGKNEQRIADMGGTLAKVEGEVSGMRNEMNEGFRRLHDSIVENVRGAR